MNTNYLGYYFDFEVSNKYSQHIITKEYSTVLNSIISLNNNVLLQPLFEVKVFVCLKLPIFKRNYTFHENAYFLIYEFENEIYESLEAIVDNKPSEKKFIKPGYDKHLILQPEFLELCYEKTEKYFFTMKEYIHNIFSTFYENYLSLPTVNYEKNEYLIPLDTFNATINRISQSNTNSILNDFNTMLLLIPNATPKNSMIYSILSYFYPEEQFLFFLPTFNEVSLNDNWKHHFQFHSFKSILEEYFQSSSLKYEYPYYYLSDSFRLYKESFSLLRKPVYDYNKQILIFEKNPELIPDKILINRNNCTIKYSNCFTYLFRTQLNPFRINDSLRFDFQLDMKIESLKNDCKMIEEKSDCYELTFDSMLPEEIQRITTNLYFANIEDYWKIIEKIIEK